MTKTEYETAMSAAQGDSDDMLSACIRRIRSLEELERRISTCHTTIREQRETIDRLHEELAKSSKPDDRAQI